MPAPCYLCGKESVVNGLCADCYRKEHPLVELPNRLEMTVCKRCGAVKIHGGWKQLPHTIVEPDEVRRNQINTLLESVISQTIKTYEVEFTSVVTRDRIITITLDVYGSPHEQIPQKSEIHIIEVRVNYSICNSCSSLSGGYYEAILQIRADNRIVTEQEEDLITEIVEHMTIHEHSKDAYAFVSGISRDKYGIDFWIGSEHLCRKIADEIQSRFLASRKENYKLVGQEKGGKDKFRITIMLRLPQYTVGDFITVLGRPCQVDAIGKNGLACYDLKDRVQFTVHQKSSKWQTIQFKAPASSKRKFMILSRAYGHPIQLMDSESFEMIEIDSKIIDDSYQAGDTIEIVFFDEFGHLPVSR